MKWTVPILMLLTLTMSFSKGLVWLEYEVNKSFISRNICINKFKPAFHCKGKCQLMKKMAEEREDNSTPPIPKLKAGFDETVLSNNNDLNLVILAAKTDYRDRLTLSSYNSPIFPVFHPPV